MNEQALKDAYDHFVKTGYKGTLQDYRALIATNDNALNDSFTYFKDTGYEGSIEDFSTLIGVEKEDAPKVNWFDQTWVGRGFVAASSTGEATNLLKQRGAPTKEVIEEFIQAKADEASRYTESEGMKEFSKKYQAEGSTWAAFFRGVKDDPMLLTELFVQSLATQVGTLFDNPDDAFASMAAGAGIGAAAGAGAGLAGGPFAEVTVPVGAVAGTLPGALGGLGYSMESALTFGELIETELHEQGKEFTDENIKELLESAQGTKIRNRAVARGLSIGSIEALSGGIAGKVTTGVAKGVMKTVKAGTRIGGKTAATATKRGVKLGRTAGAGAGLGVEGIGGGVGEVAGRLAADQEMDAAEIGFEAVTGGAVGPISVGAALLSTKTPTYKLAGVEVDYATMKDFIDTADDIDVAMADIKIENDFTGIGKLAAKKQKKAIIDSQIDSKITDQADRDKLIELDAKRRQAKADVEKTGIEAVPGAQETLDAVEKEISDIIGKYEGATDVAATEQAAEVRKARREAVLSETIAFAETAGKQIGKDVKVVDNDTDAQSAFDAMREEHNKMAEEHNAKPENADNQIDLIAEQDVSGSDGFIAGDTIFINKDVAGKTGAITVGSHEVLHGILGKHMKSLDPAGRIKLGKSFIGVLTKKQVKAVRKRLKDSYGLEGDAIFASEEIFTAFSDAIEKGEITFNEGVFSKLANTIQEILRKFGYKKEFANGRAVYNFMKEYSKNVKEGKLSKRAIAAAEGGTTATDTQFSRSARVGDTTLTGSLSSPSVVSNWADSAYRAGLQIQPGGYWSGTATGISDFGVDSTGLTKEQSVDFNVQVTDRNQFKLVRSPDMNQATFDLLSKWIDDTNKDFRGRDNVGTLAALGVEGRLGRRNAPRGVKLSTVEIGSPQVDQGVKFSRSRAVDAVNSIEQAAQNEIVEAGREYNKQTFQESDAFEQILNSILNDGGAINSYVKSIVPSKQERDKVIRELSERLINYDPQAERKGDAVGPVTVGEFLMANKNFARLVAKKELAIESQERSRTKSLDAQDNLGRTISETIPDTTETKKTETKKQQKQRILTSLAKVNLENKKIISLRTQLKIAELIEQNPANLEQQLTKLIEKDVTKAVQKEMGSISFDSKNEKIIVSDEYKAFLALAYEDIISGLDVTTIKNNYKNLFDLTKIGVEDKKTKKADKPSLKKDSNFRKAVFKIETNKAKFTKYFTDTTSDVKAQSHYNKLKARQKGLAGIIGEAIVKQAIDTEIAETSTNIDAVVKAKLREFANSLDRQKLETQGNYNDQIKFSRSQVQAALDLKSLIESGETVFDNSGKALLKYRLKYSKKVRDFVYNELYSAGLLQDKSDIEFIGKGFRKLVKAGTRGIAYEAFLIDQAIAIEKKYGKDAMEVTLRKPSEVGGLPDVQIKIHGKTFNIEAKMTNAQYSSVTFAVSEDGNFIVKKDYTFNDQIKPLGDQVQKGIKEAKSYLKKKYNYDWKDITTLPTEYYNDLKKTPVTIDGVEYSSYINAMSASMEISLDVISEIYNKKSNYPVDTIQLMGRGLFHMGTGPNPLNLPVLKGKGTMTLRIGSNSEKRAATMADVNNGTVDSIYTDGTNTKKKGERKTKRRVKSGNKKLSFRAIPGIPKSTLETLTSDKSIGNVAALDALMQSDEVAAMELVKKSKSEQVFSDAILFSRSANNETQGISVLDFDDTLATTKSKVIVTKPDGDQFKLNAEEFAAQGSTLLEEGHKFDFSEFNQVVEGEIAPLFNKALKLAKKFGTDNMYILTARAPEAQVAIKQFLDANGLNIPAENIVGLGRSEASAKAEWIAGKIGEGFNDFYFADDAIQNVRAVENMLSRSNVKAKVQQAKVKFSLSTEQNLNWKTDSIGYMTTSFNVDGNNYNVTFYPTDLDDANFELEFDLVTEAGVTQEMTGTGSQFKVLSTVYNGLLDVVKQKPGIETIGFSALTKDKSRVRVYTVLMDKLSKQLGWKNNIYEYSSGSQIDFELAKPKVPKRKAKATQSVASIPAVRNMLNQFDVKSPVQKGRVQFSRSMNEQFNNMLEELTGVDANEIIGAARARKRGLKRGRFRFFIPPSHEDLLGLLYNFMGTGRRGDAHRAFFEKALIKPLSRAFRELDVAKQSIANDFKELNKKFKDVKKKLKRKIPGSDFTFEDAIRVYLFNKNGHSVPGLTETEVTELANKVKSDPRLKAYADAIEAISRQDGFVKPTDSWTAGDLRTDLDDATGRIGRKKYLAEFLENAKIIFSEENLNKIEAEYGRGLREAIEDMLYRIETGRNRPSGSNKLVNAFVNFINAAVSNVMFFNIRSAVLQQMSIVNFLNFADNNIFAAAKAFANQKQFWADFAMIFNSPEMKQRRGGIGTDVNGAELAANIKNSRNPLKKALAELLRMGFTPTQIADSFAIAIGGAPFYRNRVKTYMKQGMSKAQAEARAWLDFQETAQATQQSARPDMVSQQQASPLGKFILAFQNVTSQFNRLAKKAFLDIKNRRITSPNSTQLQSDMSNASRIVYYLAVQNLVFYGLQQALFAMMFDEDEDDEKMLKKKGRVINGSIDSVLRGAGVYGAIAATIKNMAIKHMEQRDAGYNKDESAVLLEMLNVSPPLGIKARQIVNAEKTLNYEKDAIEEMETFDIDNPMWSAVANYISATTNIPTSQIYRNVQNARGALDERYETWQRILMSLGWSKYNIGADDVVEEDSKSKKKKKHGESSDSGRTVKRRTIKR